MQKQTIKCPKCGHEFSLDEAILKEIVGKEVEKQAQLALEKGKEIGKRELEESLEELQAVLQEKEKKLEEARAQERELRRRQRELEDKEKNLELEVERKVDVEKRKLDAERKKLEEELQARYSERYELKIKEKDVQLEDAKRKIDELQKRLEQGSQQLQGEVLELDIESLLKRCFPQDTIEPVPKGIEGADIIQTVKDKYNRECGRVIWECKRTKNWSYSWVEKLKKDQMKLGADIAAVVTTAMPKDVESLENIDGVWVINYSLAQIVATLLRNTLEETARVKSIQKSGSESKEILFNYITSPQFKQKVENIIKNFLAMKKEIDEERSAVLKMFSKREERLRQIIDVISTLSGDLEAITQSLPEIKLPTFKMIDQPQNDGG